jgi:hypothetical protein
VEFMYGPGAIKFQLFGTEVLIGSIPTGSGVASDVPQFRAQPLSWRLMAMLASPALLLAIAALLAGPMDAGHHFLTGFLEMPKGGLSPKSYAQDLLAQFHQVYLVSHVKVLGILSAKIAASALLPILGPAFVQIIRQLFSDDESPYLKALFIVHGYSAFALSGLWGYAVAYYALK